MDNRIPDYDDLQLHIERGRDGSYGVRASASDGRTGRSTFVRPITDDELDQLVRRVGLGRRHARSELMKEEGIKSLGTKLFDALMKDDVEDVYRSARAAAEAKGRGLRITLLLSGAPELMRLPWEFLFSWPKFLSESIRTPVVRSIDLPTRRRPLEADFPLRILVMVSSPQGYPALDTDQERRRLENALGGLKGLVELEWLEQATLAELGRRFSAPDDIHVLHYIGHGAYDEATEGGILALENAQGRVDDVSGEDLGTMLQDEESLRLVVLNSCEGARTSRIDPFSGVATSLLAFDIPAVIGMQFEISDDAAIEFSRSLYTGLADGLPIDAALAPARRAIRAKSKVEFGTPVLFLRATDARLFDLSRASTPGAPTPPTTGSGYHDLSADPEWADALSAYSAKQWPEAIQRLETLRARYPNEARVEERMHQARAERDIDDCSSRADAAAAEGDWDTAVTALEKLTAIDPTYPDTIERLEHARIARRCGSLRSEMTRSYETGQWDAVVTAAQELAQLDPGHHDPGGMVSTAQAKIRRAQLVQRWRRPILLLAMIVAAVAALGVVISITQKQPRPLTQTQIHATVNDSLVYMEITATGYLAPPGHGEGAASVERRTGPVTAAIACTGFVVDPSGVIATAAACVDPANAAAQYRIREGFIFGLTEQGVLGAADSQSFADWRVEGNEVGSPVALNVKVIQANGVIGDVTPANVGPKEIYRGNALVRVAGLPPLKPLVIAHQAPQPGRGLTAFGFPLISDPHALHEPVFRSGTASRQVPSPSGAPRTEIDADNSGLAGGPTVDNETGDVLGVNDIPYITTMSQSFYITDAPTLRDFLQSNGVHLAELTAPNKFSPWLWFLVGVAVLTGVLAFLIGVLSLLAGRKKGHPQRGQAGPDGAR